MCLVHSIYVKISWFHFLIVGMFFSYMGFPLGKIFCLALLRYFYLFTYRILPPPPVPHSQSLCRIRPDKTALLGNRVLVLWLVIHSLRVPMGPDYLILLFLLWGSLPPEKRCQLARRKSSLTFKKVVCSL